MVKHGMAAAADRSSSSEVTSPPSQISPSGLSDNTSIPITNHKLNGHNYLQWSRSVTMFICGKGKDDFIFGAATCPKKDDPGLKTWRSENNMVMSWLISSMTTEIGANFLLYSTAKEIWEAARDTYSCKDNTSELFEVESLLHDLKQGDGPVTVYFNSLTRCWQQLDLFEAHDWKCSDDEACYKAILEKKRVFKFLMGLNTQLDEVRGRILSTKPMPTLRDAFSAVRHEESRRKLMLGSLSPSPLEASALASQRAIFPQIDEFSMTGSGKHNPSSPYSGQRTSPPPLPINGQHRQGRLWCEKCKRPNHSLETCWKIHGKPANWKPSRERRANNATTDSGVLESQPFSKEQLDMLQKLFGQSFPAPNPSVIGSGIVAHKGFGLGEDDWQC